MTDLWFEAVRAYHAGRWRDYDVALQEDAEGRVVVSVSVAPGADRGHEAAGVKVEYTHGEHGVVFVEDVDLPEEVLACIAGSLERERERRAG